VPANLALAIAVIASSGLSRAEMGLRYGSPSWGLAIGGAAIVVLAFVPREWLRDQRLAGANAAYVVLFRIPVVTALVEEVCFRGVLLGSLLPRGSAFAVAMSSVAFGLWHLEPARLLARANGWRATVVVPAGVILTAVAGLFLGWLRVETGSVLAPFVAHVLVNSSSAAAAFRALCAPV
jgi:membrane protease YdiL (CAAX protease family)